MIISENKDIEERWNEYFKKLLNTKNRTPEIVAIEKVQGLVEDISEKEVGIQIGFIKLNKLLIKIIKKLKDRRTA